MEQLTEVAATFFIFGSSVIVVAWTISRILAHRERMELIRMGMMPQRNAQRYGSTTSAPPQSGASIPPVGMFEVENAQRSLHRGISLAFVGLALTIGLSFIGYHSGGGPLGAPVMVPGPWLLGGLIPMFVGIAQIITAILSGARISGPQQFGAPEARPKATPPPSEMPGPYAYRPGTTTELTRPVPPPDIKN